MSPKLALLICATSLIMAAPASAQNRDGDRPDRPRREEGGARPASAPTQAPPREDVFSAAARFRAIGFGTGGSLRNRKPVLAGARVARAATSASH